MPPLKYLKVRFSSEISSSEVVAFRGAVLHAIGPDASIYFHNHNGEEGYRNGYPLIQYKAMGRHAGMVCLGEGVEAMHQLLQHSHLDLSISGRQLSLQIEDLNLKTFDMRTTDGLFSYHISRWVALNDHYYREYEATDRAADRLAMLEHILGGNILSLAKGIGWQVEERVVCEIMEVENTERIPFKGIPRLAFTLRFKTNVFLPNSVGLGRHASVGFGVVVREKEQIRH